VIAVTFFLGYFPPAKSQKQMGKSTVFLFVAFRVIGNWNGFFLLTITVIMQIF
jgi:hypothetical protein